MLTPSNSGTLFWQLCQVNSPSSLWEILDQHAFEYSKCCNFEDPESILEHATEIVLFGAGKFAEAVIDFWEARGRRPDYCVDSNARKWGTTLKKIEIRNPQVLSEQRKPPLVVIAAMMTDEIEKILAQMRVPYLYAERDGSVGWFPGHWLNRQRNEFEQVYNALADAESKRVMLNVTIARLFQGYYFPMRGNYFTAEIASYPQYFRDDIFTFSKSEYFVDCGAFDGDTLIAFAARMRQIPGSDWGATAFEFDADNLKMLKNNLERFELTQVKLISAAVGSQDSRGAASRYFNCRQEDGEGLIETRSLDCALQGTIPTFIKMDIEGSELEALQGAHTMIQKHQPKLAICCYHTTRQLLDVPLFILRNFPRYRLSLRHHSAGTLWETVCYAVPC